eukprot:g33244.t1
MAAKRRLQELFEKYDTSGDGVLSEEEMMDEKAASIFKSADANQDGSIQVHEFISWLTSTPPRYKINKKITAGSGTVEAVITNTNKATGLRRKFTFNFKKCQNMDFPSGNPAEFVLKPGEQVTKTLLEVKGLPYRYSWSMSHRSEFTGIEDDLSKAFVDPEFPHEQCSIGESSTQFKCGSAEMWIRARMLGDPSEATLFDEVRPQDVLQGSLGDCWLMSSLSCLGSHPQKLKSLFSSKHLTEDGKYSIWLFDIEKSEWTSVAIDEFLPCNVRYGVPRAEFSKPLGEEIWVMLLEKAMAKFCGSYGALSGGGCAWAFQVLTGKTDVISYARERDGTWRRRRLNARSKKARNPRSISIHPSAPHAFAVLTPAVRWVQIVAIRLSDGSLKELYQTLQEHICDRHVMGCSIAGNSAGAEGAKGNGLYTNHVYSLLKIIPESLDDGSPIRLVKLRNPWGNSEWKGDCWSDVPAARGLRGLRDLRAVGEVGGEPAAGRAPGGTEGTQ